jgi:hypothetical protein
MIDLTPSQHPGQIIQTAIVNGSGWNKGILQAVLAHVAPVAIQRHQRFEFVWIQGAERRFRN